MSKNRIPLILVGLTVLFAFLYSTAIATEVNQDVESPGGDLGVDLQYTTDLIDPYGNVIRVQPLSLFTLNRLSFYSGSSTVSAMRVTVDWIASGRDVDWSTLSLTVVAAGTGGFAVALPFSTQTGSAEISLPVTTGQLGRTPASDEIVMWTMSVDVSGEIRDAVGNILTARADTVTSSLTSKWYDPTFTIDTSTPPPSTPPPSTPPPSTPPPSTPPPSTPPPSTPPPSIPPGGGPLPLGILRTWTTP